VGNGSVDQSQERLLGFDFAVKHAVGHVNDLEQNLLIFLVSTLSSFVDFDLNVTKVLGSRSND